MNQPLAERIRPTKLGEIIGQPHLTNKDSFLAKAIEVKKIPSLIFWGPPGVGKTTFANIIAKSILAPIYSLSAVSCGVKDIREVIEKAKMQENTILFIDEIHRFNKGQQDALLHAVEKGIITLMGATTENPSFEVNAALLSRCQVCILKHLDADNLKLLIKQAFEKDEWLKNQHIEVQEYEALIQLSGGDARKLLNTLELVTMYVFEQSEKKITNELVMFVAQTKMSLYDKNGEQHYDIISAFIKSMRGSDPNATVYWLARMIDGGEDVKFIARRMLIFASEDIGNANPNALLLANTTFDAVSKIGYPESRIILSQCAIYLATSVKSNASYIAIEQALNLVKIFGDLPVPLPIRNAPTSLMKSLDYGKGYMYDHTESMNFSGQEFFPSEIKNTQLYNPGNNTREEEIRKFLVERWKSKYGY